MTVPFIELNDHPRKNIKMWGVFWGFLKLISKIKGGIRGAQASHFNVHVWRIPLKAKSELEFRFRKPLKLSWMEKKDKKFVFYNFDHFLAVFGQLICIVRFHFMLRWVIPFITKLREYYDPRDGWPLISSGILKVIR